MKSLALRIVAATYGQNSDWHLVFAYGGAKLDKVIYHFKVIVVNVHASSQTSGLFVRWNILHDFVLIFHQTHFRRLLFNARKCRSNSSQSTANDVYIIGIRDKHITFVEDGTIKVYYSLPHDHFHYDVKEIARQTKALYKASLGRKWLSHIFANFHSILRVSQCHPAKSNLLHGDTKLSHRIQQFLSNRTVDLPHDHFHYDVKEIARQTMASYKTSLGRKWLNHIFANFH